MSKEQPLDFQAEAERCFQFLVDTYGLAEPDYSELLLPALHYRGRGLLIQVAFEFGDGAGTSISVGVSLLDPDWRSQAHLPRLVEAAVFTPMHLVPWKAHTPEVARRTLEANAIWLDRLMPLLLGPDADALLRKATAHEVDRAGNPRKRSTGIKWKYPGATGA